jgi:hypothetical protein
MQSPRDVASIRLDNALLLFDEFVRGAVKQADAATLRGLERRFAERLQIQPSYWSQIKGRSRQIGERLARQFEQCCRKPVGWMDQEQVVGTGVDTGQGAATEELLPQDDDERFIVGLVLTYYRRHPQRARTRLLDLLGEVLMPTQPGSTPPAAPTQATPVRARSPGGVTARPARPDSSAPAEDPSALWLKVQARVAPLKKKV